MTNELNERFSPMHVKQAIGIASDKRYAGGNMTGAVKAIEKMKKGLSDHPQVRAVLKRQNEDVNEKFDPADFDMVATDKDKAGAKMNIIMQLRKAADVRGNLPIQFADGKKAKLPPKVIELALKKFASFRKPDAKEKLQTAMGKSYKDMVHALKTMREETELDEALQHVHTIKITADAPSDAKPSEVADIKNDFKLHVQAIRGAVKRLGGLITDTEVPSRQNKFVGKIKIGTRGDASKISIPVIQKGVKSGGIELDKRQFVREEVELDEGVDKAKIQKQIDQAEKYLKSFFGNTSSVKMKKFAIQKKIEKLKKQLNEAEEDSEEDYCDCGCECGKEICESCGKPHKPENIEESKMAGWVAIYNGKKVEIKKSEAKDLYGAKMKAAKMLKVPKSKMGLLAIKPGYNEEVVNEEVQQDLQEAPNYKLYHNTFSGAVQEAIAVAKKKGFDIDEDDWHDKVATGPKKPSKDKTNSYSIKLMKKGKPVRQMLQIQVYNMGAKYELNCYVQ